MVLEIRGGQDDPLQKMWINFINILKFQDFKIFALYLILLCLQIILCNTEVVKKKRYTLWDSFIPGYVINREFM